MRKALEEKLKLVKKLNLEKSRINYKERRTKKKAPPEKYKLRGD